MKTNSTPAPALLKTIDKQLKTILEKDIRKIEDKGIRHAAFLQLIAA